jgi:predicted NAD-dependent protein-ADP-ribosyltransferase YbiA (DUF1768 family)
MDIVSFSGDYAFLSNDYPCRVSFDYIEYSSVVHALEASKTLDRRLRMPFYKRLVPYPSQAKQMGRKLVLRLDWQNVKLIILEDLLRQKFQIPDLKSKLLATKDANLIEGDLGILLMKIRNEFNA